MFEMSESQERYVDQLLTERGLEPHAAALKGTCESNADVSSLIVQLQRGAFGLPLAITVEQVEEIERLQAEVTALAESLGREPVEPSPTPTDQAGYSRLRRALLRAMFGMRGEAKANERAELIGVTLQAASDAATGSTDPWNDPEGVEAFAGASA